MGCNIELESITHAMKARDLLKKHKMRVRIEKSAGKQKKGCAYSVITDRNCKTVMDILETAGIKVVGIS